MDDMSSKYRFIGYVNDISQLYTSNNISIGDIYYVNDKQSLYIYNSGNEFIEISNTISLTDTLHENVENKLNDNISIDKTYPIHKGDMCNLNFELSNILSNINNYI